jgi:hypothetical protein
VQFYRVYHIDHRGHISGLTNFSTENDVSACERAVALMGQHNSPGAELWEGGRRVHCAGIARSESGDGPPGSLCGPAVSVALGS